MSVVSSNLQRIDGMSSILRGKKEFRDQGEAPPGNESLRNANKTEEVQWPVNEVFKNTAIKSIWDKEINRMIYQVVDKNTHTTLMQIPSEKYVEWVKAYDKLLEILISRKGLLVDYRL